MQPTNLGLALSGGGLRAAFFHAGVLARLADVGLLPKVRRLSTVSGGSIVGALYTLHVISALEAGEPDYGDIVQETIHDLSAAAQRDFRACTFANPLKSIQMGILPGYSRSDRIAELYDHWLYRRLRGSASFRLHDTFAPPLRARGLVPLGVLAVDDPRVPNLIVNATALNDGHPWRFEGKGFGEPRRGRLRRFLDKNDRLARVGHGIAGTPPAKYVDFPLAHAVAASACFPGFEPLAMTELYDGWRPQLVDGGAFDNQGVDALVHRGCDAFVVSDGSGQMLDAPYPNTRLLGVLHRVYSIAAGRIRQEQLRQVLLDYPDSAVVHLRAGCSNPSVPWQGADGEPHGDTEADFEDVPDFAGELVDSPDAWQVAPAVQERLSRIRTDLDAFSEVEAHCLMLDGYRLAGPQLARLAARFDLTVPAEPGRAWPFLALADRVWPTPDPDLLRQLDAAQSRFGKRFKIYRWWGKALFVLVVAAGVAGVYALLAAAWGWDWPWSGVLARDVPVWWLAAGVAAAVVLYAGPGLLPGRGRAAADIVGRGLVWGLLPALASPLVGWYWFVNRRRFLQRGRLDVLLRHPPAP